MELRYIRNVDGHEIDFVVLKNKKPIFAVESRTGEKDYGDAKSGRVLPFKKCCEIKNLV